MIKVTTKIESSCVCRKGHVWLCNTTHLLQQSHTAYLANRRSPASGSCAVVPGQLGPSKTIHMRDNRCRVPQRALQRSKVRRQRCGRTRTGAALTCTLGATAWIVLLGIVLPAFMHVRRMRAEPPATQPPGEDLMRSLRECGEVEVKGAQLWGGPSAQGSLCGGGPARLLPRRAHPGPCPGPP